MQTKVKTSHFYTKKYQILDNVNFLNNQNYVLGKEYKKYIKNNLKNLSSEFYTSNYGSFYKYELYPGILNYLNYFFLILGIVFFLFFIIIIINSLYEQKLFYFFISIVSLMYLILALLRKILKDRNIENNFIIMRDGKKTYYKRKY